VTLTVTYAALTDKGRVREQNEDRWAADPANGIFLVSDGIGGGFAGELASKIVAEVLPGALREKLAGQDDLRNPIAAQRVSAAIAEVSAEMRQKTKNEPGFDGMGATVVLAVVRGDVALIAHMGDSRAYLFRRGRLTQLTRDHSITQLLIDSGDITEVEAKTHPSRGKLSRCVGMEGQPLPETSVVDLRGGDKILLCTDGLTGMVSGEEIGNTLSSRWRPKRQCERLVTQANEAGGVDNITVLVLVASRAGGTSQAPPRRSARRCAS
jgi:serine/threonine protein phosphatase PrpC